MSTSSIIQTPQSNEVMGGAWNPQTAARELVDRITKAGGQDAGEIFDGRMTRDFSPHIKSIMSDPSYKTDPYGTLLTLARPNLIDSDFDALEDTESDVHGYRSVAIAYLMDTREPDFQELRRYLTAPENTDNVREILSIALLHDYAFAYSLKGRNSDEVSNSWREAANIYFEIFQKLQQTPTPSDLSKK